MTVCRNPRPAPAYWRSVPRPQAYRLILNELTGTRAELLAALFPTTAATRFDATQIDDHLDLDAVPSLVLMNPPLSAMAHVSGCMADAGFRHIGSALNRLAPGGPLATITGASVEMNLPDALQARGRVVFSAAIDGSVYRKHCTTFPTRLTVIDKRPADDPTVVQVSPGIAQDAATRLDWIAAFVSPRPSVTLTVANPSVCAIVPKSVCGYIARAATSPPVHCIRRSRRRCRRL
jgi:hypothetical protein